jgi:translation elongation factor EF-Ts
MTPADPKKKPEMIEKIVAGKVAKRMSEVCLLSQVRT